MPRDMLDEVIQFGVMAADMEALKPRPMSPIRNPDGSAQRETGAEYTRRIVGHAIRHLVEVGLLVVADDAAAKMEAGIPV